MPTYQPQAGCQGTRERPPAPPDGTESPWTSSTAHAPRSTSRGCRPSWTTAVLPAEPVYAAQRRDLAAAGRPHDLPPVVEDLKAEARARGAVEPVPAGQHRPRPRPDRPGLRPAGRAVRMVAGDRAGGAQLRRAGHREHGDPAHVRHARAEGAVARAAARRARSAPAFSMTEPEVASSDARNIATRIDRVGDEYVINGRKWWSTGANDPRCRVLIVMGKTDPDADVYHQQSMVLVPIDTPGVEIVRSVPVFGYHDQHGHAEITFTDVRVPVDQPAGRGGLAASRSPRRGSARGASTTACARSAWPSGRWTSCAAARSSGSRSASRWPARAWCSSGSPSPGSRSSRPGC